MTQIIIETLIDAPVATCFGLIRDERVITDTRSHEASHICQPVEMGQTITFIGWLFGLRQELTVEVVELEDGRRFVDEMIDGRFRSFRHTHEFVEANGKTLMRDIIEWTSPFGILGCVADKLLLERHLRSLVTTRNARLRSIAESGR